MRRFSQKTIVLTTALLLVIGAALFLIVKPDLPGRWCRDGEEWFICLREWQTLIAGLLALVSASWTVYYIRQDIAQSAKIADREHALATRVANAPLLHALGELIQKVEGMVERGERGERMLLSRSADYRYELMMDDTNLKLLERIAGFKRLREDARRELQKWHGGRVAFEPLQKLMAQLNEVYRRLHQGQEVETIAAAIDKTTASTEPHP